MWARTTWKDTHLSIRGSHRNLSVLRFSLLGVGLRNAGLSWLPAGLSIMVSPQALRSGCQASGSEKHGFKEDASEKIACHGTGESCAEDIDALCSVVSGGTIMCVCRGVTETGSCRDNSGSRAG